MTNPQHIHIADFDYPLDDSRIAKYPLAERDSSKLLVFDGKSLSEDHFYNLSDHLSAGDLMVFNNTKVIQARLHFRKSTGALIEIFLLEPLAPAEHQQMFLTRGRCQWKCLVGNLKKWKSGSLTREVAVEGVSVTLTATIVPGEREQGSTESGSQSLAVDLAWDDSRISFAELLDAVGELPIPPYLNRATEESDKRTYQTVYSKIKGSVAAPTAGLHFTERVLASLDAKGIERQEVTLHVGAGTFKPVKSDEIGGHEMHTEVFRVSKATVASLLAHDCRAVCVGTTSVRTIESLYYIGCKIVADPQLAADNIHVEQWEPYGDAPTAGGWPTVEQAIRAIYEWLEANRLEALTAGTQIIIAPGYRYKIVKRLVTNFHQPRSTLLLLVSALLNGRWREVYDYALSHGFRFLSYGDSSLLSLIEED